MNDWKRSYNTIAADRNAWKTNYERLMGEVKEFIPAIRKAPNRLRAFIEEQKLNKSQNREVSR